MREDNRRPSTVTNWLRSLERKCAKAASLRGPNRTIAYRNAVQAALCCFVQLGLRAPWEPHSNELFMVPDWTLAWVDDNQVAWRKSILRVVDKYDLRQDLRREAVLDHYGPTTVIQGDPCGEIMSKSYSRWLMDDVFELPMPPMRQVV